MRASILIVAALLVACTVARAQEPASRLPEGMPPVMGRALPEEWSNRDVRELVEAVMIARLSRELGLNDEQTVLMMRRFGEFREKSAELKKQRAELVKALAEGIKGDASEEDIASKLEALIDKDKAIAATRLEMVERGGAGLTAKQQAKLYVFMGEFENDMRRLVQKARLRAANPGDRQREFPRRFPEGPQPGQGGLGQGRGADRPRAPSVPRLGGPEHPRELREAGRKAPRQEPPKEE